jgi:hypothetical protein
MQILRCNEICIMMEDDISYQFIFFWIFSIKDKHQSKTTSPPIPSLPLLHLHAPTRRTRRPGFRSGHRRPPAVLHPPPCASRRERIGRPTSSRSRTSAPPEDHQRQPASSRSRMRLRELCTAHGVNLSAAIWSSGFRLDDAGRLVCSHPNSYPSSPTVQRCRPIQGC